MSGLGRPWGLLVITLFGCAGQPVPGSQTRSPPAPLPNVAPSAARDNQRSPFSGEIVFRMTAVARNSGDARELGELHYFISGAHWKHVDEHGDTRALYDPETQLVHYYKPESKIVDARAAEDPVSFEALPQTRVVLGRVCKAFRSTARERTIIGFYDPELFVDPAPYANHHLGHWAETMAFTHGALVLWSKMEFAAGDIVSDPIRIEPREFDASFWAVPEHPDGAATPHT